MNKLTFEQIRKSFADQLSDYQTARKILDDRIAKKQQQLERLLLRRKKAPSIPYWTESLLRPVINILKPHFLNWICDDEKLSPMGLACRVSVFFTSQNDNEKYIYIVFQPGELSQGELLYETGERKNDYPKNTIGEINGFNRTTKAVESIEELVNFLKKQIPTE